MKQDMQHEAVDIAIAAFEKCSVEKDVAEQIKKEFDVKYGPTWHCIVGKNFGSYVTHETNHFVYFYLESKAVLLFKSGWACFDTTAAWTCMYSKNQLKLNMVVMLYIIVNLLLC